MHLVLYTRNDFCPLITADRHVRVVVMMKMMLRMFLIEFQLTLFGYYSDVI